MTFLYRLRLFCQYILFGAIILGVIGFLNFALSKLNLNNQIWIFVSILQVLVAAWMGAIFFPRIFGNKDLERTQRAQVLDVADVLTAPNEYIARDRMLIAIMRQMYNINDTILINAMNEHKSKLNALYEEEFSFESKDEMIKKTGEVFSGFLGVGAQQGYHHLSEDRSLKKSDNELNY